MTEPAEKTNERSVSRLLELLKKKDEEIERLQGEVWELEQKVEADWTWCQHREAKEDEAPQLPLPRLEIVWEDLKDKHNYNIHAEYRLVFRHLLGHVVIVPLGMTKRGGSGRDPMRNATVVDLPFRDNAHIRSDAKTLRLPAFARWRQYVTVVTEKWEEDHPFTGECA